MSDDNKSLGDDLEDMIGDAKDSAKKAGEKISQKTSELAGDAKEKVSEFADDAKEAAKEFSENAKEVLSDGKNVAIIAHFTLIGWIIALVMNSGNKTEIGSFYIRQMLGFVIMSFVVAWIPFLNLLALLVLFVAWLMSLISALGGEMKASWLLGDQFQEWFKSL